MTTQTISPRARALCAALREARESRGLGIRELGRMLSIAHSAISNWESGARIPNIETVAMLLGAIRPSPDDREKILDLARNANDSNWLADGISKGIPQQLTGVIECERAASIITEWVPLGIPGLLQTSDYARSVKSTGGDLSQSDVGIRVLINSGRRAILERREPVTFHGLVSQATFDEPIGEPYTMIGQLRYLTEMAKLPNVDLSIVPSRVGWHPGWAGPFVLYEFPTVSPVVYFEHHSSGAFVTDPHDIAAYRAAVNWLRSLAYDPAQSIEYIQNQLVELGSTP